MGYENKITKLLGNSDELIRESLIKLWQTNEDECLRLDKEFKNNLISLMNDYSQEKFINLIESGLFEKGWKQLDSKRKNEILNKIEPILLYEKSFSDHVSKGEPIKFVFLETDNRIIVYCNGMYSTMSENSKRNNEHLRNALRVSSTTIRDNPELEAYAEKNEKFPVWLKELTFLEPYLDECKPSTKLKMK